MSLLLDTHTIVWLTEQVPKLGRSARRRCDAALAAGELAIPTIVFYEVGRALQRERVAASASVRDWRTRILSLGVREVPLSADIAMRASDLLNLSGDPLDRIIVATALVEQAVLLTADRRILDWPGQVQRLDAQR
ncbi:MAG TPA: type II toxin-antitoxin system VapC family toxin [Reyranella sp.]|nr:type II toxin-antitoxin system VapC family toxin [Reyranella sp.]